MYDFEPFEDVRFGWLYLRTASYLLSSDRDDILKAAIEMYCNQEDERTVEGRNYEGLIRNMKTIGVFGSFVGIKFEAELDTVYGRDRMEFIINEQTPSRQMHYNPN